MQTPLGRLVRVYAPQGAKALSVGIKLGIGTLLSAQCFPALKGHTQLVDRFLSRLEGYKEALLELTLGEEVLLPTDGLFLTSRSRASQLVPLEECNPLVLRSHPWLHEEDDPEPMMRAGALLSIRKLEMMFEHPNPALLYFSAYEQLSLMLDMSTILTVDHGLYATLNNLLDLAFDATPPLKPTLPPSATLAVSSSLPLEELSAVPGSPDPVLTLEEVEALFASIIRVHKCSARVGDDFMVLYGPAAPLEKMAALLRESLDSSRLISLLGHATREEAETFASLFDPASFGPYSSEHEAFKASRSLSNT